MSLEGIYYSELDWEKVGFLWAYRFYPDGSVLFTHASPVGHLILHTEAGPVTCIPQDVLETQTSLSEFRRRFSRDLATSVTYKSGLPAVTRGTFTTDGADISISHPYYHFPTITLTGQILPDCLLLSMAGDATTVGETKTETNKQQLFLPLT